MLDRRQFLSAAFGIGLTGCATVAPKRRAGAAQPVGVQLYSVRAMAQQDLFGTLAKLREIGFRSVEFETTCIDCGVDRARTVRAHLDDLGMTCPSTMVAPDSFSGEALRRSLEVAATLGCKLIVMPHPDQLPHEWRTLTGWRNVVVALNGAVAPAREHGLRVAYHNHQPEFLRLAQRRAPIEIIASETDPTVCLELDVANCLASDGDPAAFLRSYGSRVVALHIKDWSRDPSKEYSVHIGDGIANWHSIMRLARPNVWADCYFVEMEPQPGVPLEGLRRDFQTASHLLDVLRG